MVEPIFRMRHALACLTLYGLYTEYAFVTSAIRPCGGSPSSTTLNMDSHRSTKRRKLDTRQGEPPKSASASRSKATPATYSKKRPAKSSERNTLPNSDPITNGTSTYTSAHEAWLEAKAKSQALRGKRPGSNLAWEKDADLYDDIDGAHAHQSPLKRKKVAPNSAPAKKQLDPLRNQKSSPAVTSSPSKSAAALGFFKQFHQPKPKPQTEEAGTPSNVGAERLSNGVSHTANGPDFASTSEGDQSESSEDVAPAPDTPIRSAGKPSGKRWTYDDKPKKTFEDEIRELAEAAREQVKNDKGEETAATLSQNWRSNLRAAEAVTPGEQDGSVRGTPHTATQKKKVPQQRKKKQADRVDVPPASRSESPDRMELDDLEDRQDQPAEADQAEHDGIMNTKPTKVKLQPRSKVTPTSQRISFEPGELEQIQVILLEKLTGKRPTRLTNVESEYTKVSSLITQTITAGESNSMLVIGARGSGKSALVNQILREQTNEHQDEFHMVRLSGFIHTDDKIALREIWRQLGREMELDSEDGTAKNYADTLTTLLALLSHPAEQGREQQPDQRTKSVVFIIDEFELFASHPRQTLLYNLFDIAQSRKAPIAVLGLTTRIDVAESLEKRVKSRFSHRYVHLSQPKSFAAFQEACTAAIALHHYDLTAEERESLGAHSEVTDKLQEASKTQRQGALADWNAFVQTLTSQPLFTQHLRRIYYTTKSVSEFHASVLLPATALSVSSATTSDELLEHFTDSLSASSLHTPDSKPNILSSLSTIQLALLICAARLTAIHNIDTVPFAQGYEEYKVLASKAKLQASASGALAQGAGSRIWSKDVARGAWEDLIECGLVMEDGSRGGRVDVGLEEIGMAGVELGSWGRWCREI
ncbi:origin recognition complex subunit 4 [Vermiconidia calcicola]|uniref:Origin recognition complex subunit 4 n=1 Tax=Vermiconidia calcicola TaxID=1690605 RepID=A0ACC3MIW6_9PEZI|nr:origin recognition complex subunit 4 [Vermiconidia calcicola]